MTVIISFFTIPAKLLKFQLCRPMVIQSELERGLVYANFGWMNINDSQLLRETVDSELTGFTTI